MLQEKQIKTPEISLNYAESADNGAPMVFLHGTARWWHDWERMTPRLEPSWHLYAVDLRGHGQSGRDGDHYLLTDYARDVIALLRDEVKQPAVLVGQSLGALVALVVAAQAPELVSAVVLMDPPIGISTNIDLKPDTKTRFIGQRDLIRSTPTFEAMLAKMTELRGARASDGLTEMFARCAFSVAPEVYDICIDNRLFEGLDRTEVLEQIKAPVLLFVADWERNGAMRPEDVDLVREHVHNLTIHEFPGADHMLPFSRADEMVDVMEAVLIR
jgi:pimeloyl-ACP methyl ester carboxylesterase